MNNSVELTKDFYDRKAISKAIEAYSSIASIDIHETAQYFVCDIISSNYDSQLVLNEFVNYVLGTMNS